MESHTVGERLVAFRNAKQLSSRKVAMTIGVDPSQFLKIEKDKLDLTPAMIKELSSQYGISADWLLHGKGEMFIDGSFTTQPNQRTGQPKFSESPDILNKRLSQGRNKGALGILKEMYATIMFGINADKHDAEQDKQLFEAYQQAADEISRLRQENEQLKKEIEQLVTKNK